jgi:hypothetical protein
MALNSNFRTLTADNIEGLVDDRNYLKSGFENGTTDGWREMSVALSSGLPVGTPTIGTFNVPNVASSITLASTSTTPLSGSRSLLVTGSSGWTAGHGFISEEFTLDRMDLGKPLTVSFDYELVSGTLNFSGTLGSQTLMVYIYDATAGGANWIQPAGFLGMNQSSGPGRVSCTFQSSVVTGQKYRVAVIASQAVVSACSIEFDNFTCSRVSAPIGPVVTDWVSYTATVGNLNAGTAPNQFYRWRRVGDSIQIMGNITAGGTGIGASGDITISLPSGLSFDLTKLAIISETAIGTGSLHDVGNFRLPCSVNAGGTNFFVLIVRANSATGGNVVSNSFPSAGWYNAPGDSISFELMAPISGWSSSTQLSSDTDTRIVDFRAYTTSARTVNNTTPTIIFENVDKDSHGSYNASTGVYTVPVSGDYVISGQMRIGPLTMTAGAFFGFSVKVDGVYSVRNHYTSFRAVTTSSAGNYAEDAGSVLIPNLRAGQTLSVGAWGDNATSTFTDGANTFCIQRISGPSVVASTETVAMRVNTATNNIPYGSTSTSAIFSVVEYDTHGAYSTATGRFTAPVSGRYRVSAACEFNGITTTNYPYMLYVFKNSSQHAHGGMVQKNSGATVFMSYSDSVQLNAGDTIRIAPFQADVPSLARALTGNAQRNYFSIERVGN